MDTDGFEISYCIVLKQTLEIIIKTNSMWNNGHTFQRMEEDLQIVCEIICEISHG